MIGKKFSSDDQVLSRLRRVKFNYPRVVQHGLDIEAILDDFKRDTVEDHVDDHMLTEDDWWKTLTMNAAGTKTFTLPAVVTEDIGLWVVLIKRGAGKLVIQAAAGETINDSVAGGMVYNDLAEETFALVRLKVIVAATWIIEFFTGSGWRTS